MAWPLKSHPKKFRLSRKCISGIKCAPESPVLSPQKSNDMKPKVLVADEISKAGVKILQDKGLEPVLEHGLSESKLASWLRKVDAVIVRSSTKIFSNVLGDKTKISVIGRAGIGVDNIDVAAATNRGIVVLNTPDANAATTAELAIAHLFSLSRHLTTADASVRAGKWERSKLIGTEIAGKTIGIVGYGTIGRIVAERSRGLNLKVLVYDPFVSKEMIADEGNESSGLAKLLKESDFVTIHAPGNKDTMGMIGKKELALMKKSAYLIQCARGGIVVEEDLAAALKAGKIAGAAVDVFSTEPLPKDNVLRKAPNLVFTPHLGASTAEAQHATGHAIASQIATFLKTGEAVNAVNLPRVAADVLAEAKPYLPLAKNLGYLLGHSCSSLPVKLDVHMAGLAADLPETVIVSEALAGMLEPRLSIPVNQVNAISLAERQGLKVSVRRDHTAREFATLLSLSLECHNVEHKVSGTLLGGAQPRIANYEGIEIEAPLTGPVLITTHKDKPGVVANLASVLSKRRINISHMHVGSDKELGRAAAFICLDKMLDDGVVKSIAKTRHIDSVTHLHL